MFRQFLALSGCPGESCTAILDAIVIKAYHCYDLKITDGGYF